MDITVKSNDLAHELILLERIAPSKPTIPILGHVLLHADAAGGVRLATTNMEVGLITSVQSQVDMAGSLTLPIKKLMDMIRLLPDVDVRLVLSDSKVQISAGRFSAQLQTLPAADFPRLPSMKGLPTKKLTGLRDLIRKTRFAVTEKDKRYFMNGALLVLGETSMMLVATDGHRLARAAAPYTDGVGTSAIIPSGTMDKLMDLAGAEVTFAQSERHEFFASDGRLLISRMVEGQFPAWERIVPRGHDKRIEFNAGSLNLALQRVGLTADETQVVSLFIRGGAIDVSSSSPAHGAAVEQVPVTYTGPDIKTAVNGPYVLDFLNATDGGAAVLEMKDEVSPLMFSVGAAYLKNIMPVRL